MGSPVAPLVSSGRLADNAGVRTLIPRGFSVILLLWAFRVSAQFGTGPAEHGWVATATPGSCDAAQRAFLDLARIHGTTVDLGDCRELTPDDLRLAVPTSPSPNYPSATEYYGVPRGTSSSTPSRGPLPTPR